MSQLVKANRAENICHSPEFKNQKRLALNNQLMTKFQCLLGEPKTERKKMFELSKLQIFVNHCLKVFTSLKNSEHHSQVAHTYYSRHGSDISVHYQFTPCSFSSRFNSHNFTFSAKIKAFSI